MDINTPTFSISKLFKLLPNCDENKPSGNPVLDSMTISESIRGEAPGVNVMIFKIFSAKKWPKRFEKMAIFSSICSWI
jgi:hypothetical protein